jgi:hypothetical protein
MVFLKGVERIFRSVLQNKALTIALPPKEVVVNAEIKNMLW